MIKINENFGKVNFKEMCIAQFWRMSMGKMRIICLPSPYPNLFVNVRISHQNSESGSKKAR